MGSCALLFSRVTLFPGTNEKSMEQKTAFPYATMTASSRNNWTIAIYWWVYARLLELVE